MQLTLDIGLEQAPSLSDFRVGANAELLAHLQIWLGQPGLVAVPRSPLPIYIWGSSGCGKSHLLRALRVQLQEAGESVGWLDHNTTRAQAFDPGWSAVLFDGVEAFDLMQQQQAFQWFIEAQTQQKAVVAAGRLPPADLQLRDDLRSRLGWGDVFALQPLDDQARRTILQTNAQARGLRLSDDVVDYLLSRFSRDLGSLMHVLDQIDHYALQSKRAITIPLIKDMMDKLTENL